MINVSDITEAVETALKTDPVFNGYTIERSEFVNENPALCPWVGIYRGGMQYNPETLGQGPDHWTGIMTLRLVVQEAHYESGAEAESALETRVKAVISKVFSDTTLRGTIDIVNDVSVTYSYLSDDEETMYFQAALIEMKLEVSTS